jgi:hypothetical protein
LASIPNNIPPTRAVQALPLVLRRLAVKSHTSRSNNADSIIFPRQSLLQGIVDLIENLSTQACYELTHRFLTTASSLPTKTARQRTVLITIILLELRIPARPRKATVLKALRLAYWNVDGVFGMKLELHQFLSEHGVEICLLNEAHIDSD